MHLLGKIQNSKVVTSSRALNKFSPDWPGPIIFRSGSSCFDWGDSSPGLCSMHTSPMLTNWHEFSHQWNTIAPHDWIGQRLTPRMREASRTISKSFSDSRTWITNWSRVGSRRNDCSSYMLAVTRVLLMILIHLGNSRSLQAEVTNIKRTFIQCILV